MKRSLLIAAATLAMLGASAAETGPQAESPAVLASIAAGAPTRMVYELDAKAMVFILPATGRASFTVDLKPESYAIKSRVRTTGLADVFVNYDMNLKAEGKTRAGGLKTTTYVSQNKDGKKNRRVELNMTDTGFSMTAKPKFGNLGDPAATAEQAILTNDPITALITFALEPRAPGADACGGPIKVFDGRQLTYLHLKRAGTGTVKVKTSAWSGQAIECHVTMDKVAGYKKGESNNDTLTGISGPLKMFLAPLANGAHVPVKIVADTDKIGKITLTARTLRFEPLVTASATGTGNGGGQ
ncbi:MAG: DUF3108 domain-containing protein [Hyphomonas sp.]|uniref:DUF3108 domain-containing protein n=1 Tax=Hyphomonas sp. TaxID=87 RepID=UPI0017C77B9D|nr:DUF3108 domain-containing protein [Hyphomonas sp.]MBU3922286.1 DUF3108 domain-containing protein [Alphaproteobacteria bacterium]MBA3068602.1 DUF3108 domain-containing protein [Hyphomonas sp.]MBU4061921.1 DUF3108 domain-containing protein [Alphaproteobacteria bacterium]MBU4166076.1 DUF3108 domain-containing protein [Alphaproteobacteria bacterium]MBU4567729.1 DUF3108 domain-containing protein [Alphaproteobacteria bacterium]